jgi:hypothetical protein
LWDKALQSRLNSPSCLVSEFRSSRSFNMLLLEWVKDRHPFRDNTKYNTFANPVRAPSLALFGISCRLWRVYSPKLCMMSIIPQHSLSLRDPIGSLRFDTDAILKNLKSDKSESLRYS